MVTHVPVAMLQAALRREGVWLIDAFYGNPTDFYHRCCWLAIHKTRPMPSIGPVVPAA